MKCQPKELLSCLTSLKRVGLTFTEFDSADSVACKAALWKEIIFLIPKVKGPSERLLGEIKMQAAKNNNKTELWTDPERYPLIEDAEFAILHVENELADELKKSSFPFFLPIFTLHTTLQNSRLVRKLLKSPGLDYVSVLNDEVGIRDITVVSC